MNDTPILNGPASIPEPMRDIYPDGGSQVIEYVPEDIDRFQITAHPGGIFRVWRIDFQIGDWSYYPIRVVGMTAEEIERSIGLACSMLDLPANRKARRARGALH
jgi:hypothetical protein